MDQVHFLNIEYIVLHLSDLLWGMLAHLYASFTGTPEQIIETQGFNSPRATSDLLGTISFTAEQLALLGFAVAIILLAMGLYIRIKLELYEHEEFHKRDAKYHHGDAHGSEHVEHAHTPDTVNPTAVRWEEVQRLAASTQESDWRRAILEADIMLGEALDHMGYRGSTVGERLKDANPLQMTTLDIAWQAHKVRNEIAHGGENYHLSEWDAKGTIDFYRRVFEELKFI